MSKKETINGLLELTNMYWSWVWQYSYFETLCNNWAFRLTYYGDFWILDCDNDKSRITIKGNGYLECWEKVQELVGNLQEILSN
ncbi:hypothetical protein N9137_03235 [Pseudomonadales bacterium]|nr:hypothetical protein [Pseudomonadales bacterium]